MNLYPDEDYIGEFTEKEKTMDIASVVTPEGQTSNRTVIFPEDILSPGLSPAFQIPNLPMINEPLVIRQPAPLIGPVGWGVIAAAVLLMMVMYKKPGKKAL